LATCPAVDEYKQASAELRAAGHDVETFNRVYKYFGSWSRAKEALTLSETTTPVGVEARFRYRKLGKVWRFTDDNLRDAMNKCFEHYGHVPTVAEYEFWRGPRAGARPRRRRRRTHAAEHGPAPPPLEDMGSGAAALRLHARPGRRTPGFDQRPARRHPDGYAPPGLPMAELAPVLGRAVAGTRRRCGAAAGGGLPGATATVAVRADGAVWLAGGGGDAVGIGAGAGHGKGGAAGSAGPVTLTLKACAEPLGLHLDRVRQLQLAAVETLAEATFETPVSDAEQRESVLRVMRMLAAPSRTR